MSKYVHGYSEPEASRLRDQADILAGLLHHDTLFPAKSSVLECGCGTGAQTVHLAANNPGARITSVDISGESLEKASQRISRQRITNVTFHKGDLFNLPFENDSFDHGFICFVLEHLSNPKKALAQIKEKIKPGGSLTVIEGDHGSWYCHPETRLARKTVECLIALQADMGGDSLIGRALYPLLVSAGFDDTRVEPKMVYADSSRPEVVEGFSKNTFIAMIKAVEKQAMEKGLMDRQSWEQGIRDLYRATEEDGVFCYTFFKAVSKKPL